MENHPHTEKIGTFKAASQALCPRCRKGKIFSGPVYGLKIQKMKSHCDYCGLRYEREPGYFYVSMFVSYAFSVAEMISVCVATYILTGNDSSFWLYTTTALLTVFLLAPFNYRYSRVTQMYWLTPGLNYMPHITQVNKAPGSPEKPVILADE